MLASDTSDSSIPAKQVGQARPSRSGEKHGWNCSSRSPGAIPEYGDMHRECLISERCAASRDWFRTDLQDLGLFRESLEGFIEREAKRIAAHDKAPPHEYGGWWLEDIVAAHLPVNRHL